MLFLARHQLSRVHQPPLRGFSLWEFSVLLGLVGVAIVAGLTLLRASDAYNVERERHAQIYAADRAIEGFIAANSRLPCPDVTGDGIEDCTASAQKGWLPVATLGLDASAPARNAARLKYIAYRGTEDLTVLSERYIPFRFTDAGETSGFTTYLDKAGTTLPSFDRTGAYVFTPPNLNTLDFCAGLYVVRTTIAASGANTSAAYVTTPSGGARNVAYALAESGSDKDGDGDLFDGNNAAMDKPALDSPARGADGNYDDLVMSREIDDLRERLKCPQATTSIEAIAHGVEINVTVMDFQTANVINGVVLSVNAAATTALDIASVALTIGSVVEGGVALGKASAALAADIASCIVLVGCAKIPIDIAAIALDSTGIAMGSAAAAWAGAIGIPLDIYSFAAAVIVTSKAGTTLASGTTYPESMLNELLAAVKKAEADATTAEKEAIEKRQTATNRLSAYNFAATTLYGVSGQDDDARLANILTLFQAYEQATVTYENAEKLAETGQDQAEEAEKAAASAEAAAAPTNTSKQKIAVAMRSKATEYAQKAATAQQTLSDAKNAKDYAETAFLAARSALGQYYGPITLDTIYNAINSATTAYKSWNRAEIAAQAQEEAAVTARQNATEMRKAYESLALSSSGATGGAPLEVFSPGTAVEILRQADSKGAVE